MPDIIKRLKWWIEGELEAGRKSTMEDAAYDIEEMRGLLEEIKNSRIKRHMFHETDGEVSWWLDWNKRADAVIERTANPTGQPRAVSARSVGPGCSSI